MEAGSRSGWPTGDGPGDWRTRRRGRPDAEYLLAIAPRVAAWLALAAPGGDPDGEAVPIPAEAHAADPEGGWRAFYAIPTDLLLWVIRRVQRAHLPLASMAPRSTPPAASSGLPSGGATPPPTSAG